MLLRNREAPNSMRDALMLLRNGEAPTSTCDALMLLRNANLIYIEVLRPLHQLCSKLKAVRSRESMLEQ